MIRLPIINLDITLELFTKSNQIQVTIKHGRYDGNGYHTLIITNNSTILEGERNLLLADDISAVYLSVKSYLDRIAEITGKDDVYIMKTQSIEEGKEREILEKLLS